MSTLPLWAQEILAKPTVTVPEAAKVLGIKGKNAAYAAAAAGQIHTLKFGRRLVVPTTWLATVLGVRPKADAD